MQKRNFASDNNSGVCPEAWAAMASANNGHATAYGTDAYTEEVCDLFRKLFETDCEIFFTFNGTAANSLALAAMCRPYHSVLCHSLAHVETDECGAPEFYSGGSKILLVDGEDGKVTPDSVEVLAHKRTDIHFPKPRVLSLTQATEVGTVYSREDLQKLGAITHGLGLKVHMDGARFANAIAHLGCPPKDITWKAGVDVLCFGGTKNGLAVGEAVIFFNKELSQEFEYRCKQAGQLCSKMRFLSAPWLGILRNNTWIENGRKANAAAQRLKSGLEKLELPILFPVQANSVFVRLDDRIIAGLQFRGWKFYDFIGAGGCRLMCSWDTQFEEVDAFLTDVGELLNSKEDRRSEVEVLRH
jgi:threonine aldolase